MQTFVPPHKGKQLVKEQCGSDSLVSPVPHHPPRPFPSFQLKISSSQETQQSLLQEKLREHRAEKEKLNEERLQQEEKLKAKVKWLLEEKAVRSLSFPLLLETDEVAFSMRNQKHVLRWRKLPNSLFGVWNSII